MGSEDGWRAIHLFYHADHDIALTRIVAPVVDRSVRDGAIRQRFVLRHWEGGPHIRIRVLPNATVDPDDVTGGLMADLEEALATEPSHAELDPTAFQAACRHFAELEGQMSDPAPLGKDNTLAQKPYVREYGKYGGPAGMETAERVFDTSTTLAFAALPRLVSSSQARHGHAFAMMLIAAIGFGLARRDLRDWFTTYQGVWGVGANAAEQAGWGRSLDRLRPPLGRIAQTCLHGSGMDPVSAMWHDCLSNAAKALARSDVPNRDHLLMQFIHTHNNRLGVTVSTEAYLAYLIAHIVDTIPRG